MERREYLKLLLAGTLGTGLFLTSACSPEVLTKSEEIIATGSYGRTEEEKEHDLHLNSETFFTGHERKTVELLCDIIIPADEVSGSATDAGVPDFIEFMMKDFPAFQVPTRGGLMWLDNQCKSRYGKVFIDCSENEQLSVTDMIAWPDTAEPDMEYGVRFFNRMRNLTATGFFTSRMGIRDLGYVGNRPNVWDGVPVRVLQYHGLNYDQKTLDECIKPGDRDRVAEWDENGYLL
ncbi:MAG: gluconate 2-dehydrogenase subunit 3 family protein [Cyclonatronaceae bacterium]